MMKIFKEIKNPLRISAAMLLICGLAYPLLLTGISQLFFRHQANGSLVTIDGHEEKESGNISTDLLTAPGSGLDPHISLSSAAVQVPDLAKATGLTEETLEAIVKRNKKPKTEWE